MESVASIQKQLGLGEFKVSLNPVTSANRVPLMANGTVDLECGSATNNMERQKQVAFTPTTFLTATRLIAKKSVNIQGLTDLRGKTLVSTSGTSNLKELIEINAACGPGITIVAAKDHAEAFLMKETGRVVALSIAWMYLFQVGMVFTLKLTAQSMAGGIVLGTILALMRLFSNRLLARAAGLYVNVVRAVPLVLVIFWFYFLFPYLGAWLIGSSEPLKIGLFVSSLLTCECMANVVLPQAFRNMTPLLLTQAIVLFQDVSLAYMLSLTDFAGAASKIAQRDGRLVEMYLFVAVVYFVLRFGLSQVVKRVHHKMALVR